MTCLRVVLRALALLIDSRAVLPPGIPTNAQSETDAGPVYLTEISGTPGTNSYGSDGADGGNGGEGFNVTATGANGAPLTAGRHAIVVEFDHDGGIGTGGTLYLSVDGRPEESARLERTVPIVFSMSGETFDVGCDTGAPVGSYPHQFDCTADILGCDPRTPHRTLTGRQGTTGCHGVPGRDECPVVARIGTIPTSGGYGWSRDCRLSREDADR